jgi:TRAP-type C4-dicarboxylate transport system substrate-binding protein
VSGSRHSRTHGVVMSSSAIALRAIGFLTSAVMIAAACSASSQPGDKGGGAGEPVVLKMASSGTGGAPGAEDPVGYFIHRLGEVSGAQITIDFASNWDNRQPDVEQQIVRDVAAGKADLAVIPTRGFDLLGVKSFQALQAPMLIDSYALQDAVAKSDIATEMLRGLGPIGVTGISVLTASMPLPIAVEKPLLSPADWQGVTFNAYRSDAQAAAIRALGAIPSDTLSGRSDGLKSGQIQGWAGSLLALGSNVTENLAPYVTANVHFWPEIRVVLANPASLARLSDEQRGWLRQAAADTLAQSTALIDREDALATTVCEAGARLADASDADLAALRRAFEPVYAELDRDPETKMFIDQIEALKKSTVTDPPVAIPSGCTGPAPVPPIAVQNAASSSLNGIYRWTLTKADALAHGLPSDKTSEGLAQLPSISNRTLKDGTWTGDPDPNGNGGTYSVDGNRVTFKWGCCVLTFTFSRDASGTLHLTPVPPMDPGDAWVWSTEPWIKIG